MKWYSNESMPLILFRGLVGFVVCVLGLIMTGAENPFLIGAVSLVPIAATGTSILFYKTEKLSE